MATLRDRLLLVDRLNDIFGRLDHLIIMTRPSSATNEPEREALQALVRARDEVGDAIDRLLHQGVKDVAGTLAGPTESLSQLQKDLGEVKDDIEGAKAAVQIASQVVQVVTKLLVALV